MSITPASPFYPHTQRRTRREWPLWARGAVIGLAVVGLGAAAYVEGSRSGRWGAPAERKAAAAKLADVPRTFGAWTSQDVPLDEKVVRVAEADGYVQRNYRSGKTGAEVTVLLLCGPSGPIGAHTPEYCYAGNGYAVAGAPEKRTVAVGSAGASYWSARFERQSPPGDPLRVCWMWGTDGDWEAADNPRLGLKTTMYKLYVVRSEPVALRDSATDPAHEFLTEFLPEVKKALSVPPALN
ncbi:exosortase-associated EpsI family protein [Gemmata sp. JC717]|uniref:exosortase-associated EpsI family protein n=1 Tax=Gemmata algarum TaxID=2975278 RepID=UPI0021BB546B|nr:exosortase-associated EpsI family protein [Gemmata algarum]MDY3552099.1 exosortase-associated EpsI family protein [Gemmata algarum]